MNELSIICCYNRFDEYNSTLVKSLRLQTNQNYELIGVDNSKNQYSSAAQALNYGIKMSCGKYVVTVHQDFEFIDPEALDKIIYYLKEFSSLDVIGVAGAVIDNEASLLKKIIGRNRKICSSMVDERGRIVDSKPLQVNSLDECCFAFLKDFWIKHPFDEQTCNKWDLYCVEMCLYTATKGGKAYVVPIKCIHHSGGNLTNNFYVTLRKLSMKYRNNVDNIITPCVVTKTKHYNLEYAKLTLINIIRKIKR